MKHLKTFKIFESSSEDLMGIIYDIFISLSDIGIEYHVDNLEKIGLVHIVFYEQSQDVDNSIDHLVNYLDEFGNKYFIGREIKGETHVSIENNFNQEIEKDFLEIIKGIREDRLTFFVGHNNYCLFHQDSKNGRLWYDYDKIYSFFLSKYSLQTQQINEIVRYLVGKHLKLEALTPTVDVDNTNRAGG